MKQILHLFQYLKTACLKNSNNLKFLLKIFSLTFFLLLVHTTLVYKYEYVPTTNEFRRIFINSLTFIALLAPVFFFLKPKPYFVIFFFVIFGGMIFDSFYLVQYKALLGRGIIATLAIATLDSVTVVLSAMSWITIIVYLSLVSFVLFLMVVICKFFLKDLSKTHQNRTLSILLILPFAFSFAKEFSDGKISNGVIMDTVKPIPVVRMCGSYINFRKGNAFLIDLCKNPKNPENVTVKNKGVLGVVVIGESATRYNHSLYGYERDTNPNLSTLKDNMVLFDDVVAKIALTCKAFEYAFLLRDENKIPTTTVSDILRAADFDVYYISANSIYLALVSPQKMIFSNAKPATPEIVTGNADQDLLLYVKNNININPEKNTLIFLGLNGSHAPYKKHFPEKFKIFNDDNEVSIFKDLNKKERQILNDYDNSLLHTDSFLYDIIECFSKSEKDTFLLYFSDHGDAPFNDEFKYRSAKIGYPYNYEIPMFLWYSENYKLHNPELIANAYLNKSKPFQTYEVLYTILDLASVSFDGFSYEKSLVSNKFEDQNNRYIFEESILYDRSKRTISEYEK